MSECINELAIDGAAVGKLERPAVKDDVFVESNELKRKLERKESELKRREKDHTKEVIKLNREIGSLKSQLVEEKERNHKNEVMIKDLSTRLDERANYTVELKGKISKLDRDVQGKLEEIDVLKMRKQEATERVATLEAELTDARAADVVMKPPQIILQPPVEVVVVKTECDEADRKELDDLRAHVSAKDDRLKNLTSELERIRDSLSHRNAEYIPLEASLETLQVRNREQQTRCNQLDTENKQLEEKLRVMTRTCDLRLEQIIKSDQEIKGLKRKSEELARSVASYEADISSKMASSKCENELLETYKKIVSTLENDKSRLTTLLARIEEKAASEKENLQKTVLLLTRTKQDEYSAKLNEERRRKASDGIARTLKAKVLSLESQVASFSEQASVSRQDLLISNAKVSALYKANLELRQNQAQASNMSNAKSCFLFRASTATNGDVLKGSEVEGIACVAPEESIESRDAGVFAFEQAVFGSLFTLSYGSSHDSEKGITAPVSCLYNEEKGYIEVSAATKRSGSKTRSKAAALEEETARVYASELLQIHNISAFVSLANKALSAMNQTGANLESLHSLPSQAVQKVTDLLNFHICYARRANSEVASARIALGERDSKLNALEEKYMRLGLARAKERMAKQAAIVKYVQELLKVQRYNVDADHSASGGKVPLRPASSFSIDLTDCGIDDETLSVLIDCLLEEDDGQVAAPYLSRLSLRANKLTDAACVSLAELLQTCPRLCVLDLRENSITESGRDALFVAVQNNPSISEASRKQGGAIIEGTRASASFVESTTFLTGFGQQNSGFDEEKVVVDTRQATPKPSLIDMLVDSAHYSAVLFRREGNVIADVKRKSQTRRRGSADSIAISLQQGGPNNLIKAVNPLKPVRSWGFSSSSRAKQAILKDAVAAAAFSHSHLSRRSRSAPAAKNRDSDVFAVPAMTHCAHKDAEDHRNNNSDDDCLGDLEVFDSGLRPLQHTPKDSGRPPLSLHVANRALVGRAPAFHSPLPRRNTSSPLHLLSQVSTDHSLSSSSPRASSTSRSDSATLREVILGSATDNTLHLLRQGMRNNTPGEEQRISQIKTPRRNKSLAYASSSTSSGGRGNTSMYDSRAAGGLSVGELSRLERLPVIENVTHVATASMFKTKPPRPSSSAKQPRVYGDILNVKNYDPAQNFGYPMALF